MPTETAAPALLYTCPAYDVIEGPRERYKAEPALVLKARDQLACKGLKSYYLTFQIDSVVSYALEGDRCPIAAVERAKERKHDLWFIFGLAVSITAHRQERKTYIGVEIGQRVFFEGRYFEIVKTGIEHLGLKEIPEA